MKTMRLKKLLFALVAMFLSTTAWAEDLVAWNDYSTDGVKHFRWFVYSDGRLELSAGADMGDGEIPAIAYAAPFISYKDQISKLVVNNGIKNLPMNLFLDIPLVTVDLTGAGDLTDITGAFYGNKELETVYLGNKITTIGDNAFRDCKALTTIVESTETAYLTKVTSIGDYAFSHCEALKTIQFVHNNPVNVGKNAFAGCTSLESFAAFNVGSVGVSAFLNCTSLKGFTGGLSGPTSIGDGAFSGCTSLEYCTAASGLTSLGIYAFKGCTSLKYLDFRTSLGSYWDRASDFSDIPDAAIVYLPAGCTVVGHNMVAGETCPDFRLYEGSEYKGIKSFTANKVTYERTMAADKLYTICLPYVYKNAAWKYYQIDKVTDNTITFKEIDQESLAADEPYLVSTGTAGVSNLNATVATAISGGYGVTKAGDFEFRGTFKEISNEYLTGETKNFYILQTDKSWKKVTTTDKTAYVPPFRGYIGTNKAVGARELMIDFEDDVTGVKQIKTVGLDGAEQYYDLSGRRLSQPKKGINIVNGRKVIIK